LLNLSSLGNDAGVSHATASAWIGLLQASYIVHLLPPWFNNAGKRLVKSPKLYFHDVGLACWLLGLRSAEQVARDPLWGALFENFIVMEALKDQVNSGRSPEMYFYRDSAGNEVDLLLPLDGGLHAIEIKAGATVNADYFKGLKTFAAHCPQTIRGGSVIFGGEQSQPRYPWPVHSWRALAMAPRPAGESRQTRLAI
jgi:predicted AAA+ superfamily ATPase